MSVSGGPPVVVITSRSFATGSADVAADLTEAGLTVVRAGADHDLRQLSGVLEHAVGWIAGTGPITAAHLDAAPRLRVLARYGVGLDSVDLVAARERGVQVTNTPGDNAEGVAEHALALLLAGLRNVVAGDRATRAGVSTARPRPAREIAQLTLGVAGFGRVGRGLARRVLALGGQVVAYDPFVEPAELDSAGVRAAGLADLAEHCDAVSLHAPGPAGRGPVSRPLIDAGWLDHARPGLLLVNTARASLVDEEALARALREDRIGAYLSDVVGDTGVLLAADLADRVVATPHVASHTVESIDRMGRSCVRAVLDVLVGDVPQHLVEPGRAG